jgi:uncharacterized protein (TIGR02284 family)
MASSLDDKSGVRIAICSVIQSLIESQEALVEIGEKLANVDLKRFFLAESLKRAEFRGELESILNQEDVSGVREGHSAAESLYLSALGSVFRSVAGLRSRLRDAGDHTLLETAEQGEDAARDVYDYAMNANLPEPVREVLASQAEHIQESRDFVKAALAKAA